MNVAQHVKLNALGFGLFLFSFNIKFRFRIPAALYLEKSKCQHWKNYVIFYAPTTNG
jgi:hypothetical protein